MGGGTFANRAGVVFSKAKERKRSEKEKSIQNVNDKL